MKRIKCPKCKEPIIFDETQYGAGEKIVLQCPHCQQSFAFRFGVSKKKEEEKELTAETENEAPAEDVGFITVIENVFHYKMEIPLQMGVNKIGRYQKSNPINIPLHTDDPSVDLLHCTITVSRDKRGQLKYVLKDGPSFTGTFVDNVILGDREQRVIEDGQLFTIGATSIILHAPESDAK